MDQTIIQLDVIAWQKVHGKTIENLVPSKEQAYTQPNKKYGTNNDWKKAFDGYARRYWKKPSMNRMIFNVGNKWNLSK